MEKLTRPIHRVFCGRYLMIHIAAIETEETAVAVYYRSVCEYSSSSGFGYTPATTGNSREDERAWDEHVECITSPDRALRAIRNAGYNTERILRLYRAATSGGCQLSYLASFGERNMFYEWIGDLSVVSAEETPNYYARLEKISDLRASALGLNGRGAS